MNKTVEELITKRFEKEANIKSLLQLDNILERIRYDIKDDKELKTRPVSQEELEKLYFDNFRKFLPEDCKKMDFQQFKNEMASTRASRYKAGVVAEIENSLLTIINTHSQLNFPKGKEDFSDNKIQKATAFREFGEEAGIWVDDEQYESCNEYIIVKDFDNVPVKFYFLKNLSAKDVDLKYRLNYETNGLNLITKDFEKKSSMNTTRLFDRVLFCLKIHDESYRPPTLKVKNDSDPKEGLQEYKLGKKKFLERKT